MSQSDYIAFKRRAVQIYDLNNNTEYPSVFNSEDYTVFREFAAEKNISSTSPTYNQLVPSGSKRLFHIETKRTNCPTFAVHINTHLRPNRLLNMGANLNMGAKEIPVISVLSSKKYIKPSEKLLIEKNCDLYYNRSDSSNSNYNKPKTTSHVIPTGSHITNALGSLYRLNHLNKCNA